jgi:hypothetical protein
VPLNNPIPHSLLPIKTTKVFGKTLQSLASDCKKPMGPNTWKADDDDYDDDDDDDGCANFRV